MKRKKKTNKQTNSIEPLYNSTWNEILPRALTLLKKIGSLVLSKEKIEEITSETVYDAKTYILSFIILSLVSSVGVIIYGLWGGANYFNNWYLALMPIMSIITATILFLLTTAILYYFISLNKVFTQNKNRLFKYIIIVFIPSQLAWLFYPIKLNWPALNRHVSIISFIILCFMSILILRQKPEKIKTKTLLFGIVLLSIPYYTLLFFNQEMAAFIVRLFGL